MNERQAVDEIMAEEKLWTNGSIVLYHVTPAINIEPIMAFGIRPDLARGKMNASWYVSRHGITWAIAHCSLRHDISVSSLVVMTAMLPMLAVRKTGIRNAWCTKSRFTPDYWTPAEFFLYPKEGEDE